MRNILLLGAGMSCSTLIKYLLDHSEAENWHLHIVDQNLDVILSKLNGHPRGTAHQFDALNAQQRKPHIQDADIVISMLPPKYHVDVAKDCLLYKKHLLTPSYVTDQMRALDQEALDAGVLILNEIGLDPGIDHMSAMKIIDEIRFQGGKLSAFKSYCGGLIAPIADNNLWHYKFTWNPSNVILAGQGSTACYLENKQVKYINYHRLFEQLDTINIEGYGEFEGYANRDSLSYIDVYGLKDIETIFRGTLRRPPFCQAWNVFVRLGMTENHFKMKDSELLSPRQFLNSFLPFDPERTVEQKLTQYLGDDKQLYELFSSLDFFNSKLPIGLANASPAELLQQILVKKWKLQENDKDMVVMYHEFIFSKGTEQFKIESSLVVEGKDQRYTAMSDTVGLPLAIATKLILNENIKGRGVQIPVNSEVYLPILNELADFGIIFTESLKTI